MLFEYQDGGREEAGFKGKTRDCVTRSIAIVAQVDYKTVYDALNNLAQQERSRKVKKSAARTGVRRGTYEKYLFSLGFKWVPTMKIGQGCKVHLRAEELPPGRLVVACSKHLTAVINGVIQDTYDPSREGTRCVYGYYFKEKLQ